MTIYAWSTTAASNASADGTINFAENQAPSTVNDSARALMARVAAWVDTLGGALTYGGSSNAYTATSPSGHALAAYAAGVIYMLKANHTNTGAATLNVDGLGARSIKTADGGDPIAGDIVSGGLYLLAYDGTVFQIVNTIGGGSYQPLDATLTAWGALSGSANQIAYWTGTDTFALTGFTAFGRSLVDDADAAAGRTTLGLGTAATVNTGTSGATIPLLNGANTWSGAQTITTLLTLQNGSDRAIDVRDSGGTVRGFVGVAGIDGAAPTNALRLRGEGGVFLSFNGGGGFSLTSASAATLGGSTVWHAGNDGAGSTMDADLLDGLQATAFGRLGVANTWTAAQTFNVNPEIPVGIYARFGLTGTNDWYLGKPNTTDLYLYRDAGVAWIISGSGLEIALGTLLAPIRIGSETSGTLTSASRNTQVHCSGNITLPASGMTDGDIILIDPRGTARTITRPSAHTMYVNDSDVATATTPAHNLVSAKFCGGSKWVLQGAT